MNPKALIIFGTRPEAIKMAPLVAAMRGLGTVDVRVCVTAQHRDMLDQVLKLFDITPEYDLNLMTPGQSLSDITIRTLEGVSALLDDWCPNLVLVHGDTTTSAIASMACFYKRIPVGHVEAGLRTHDIGSPWPEEYNRRLVGLVGRLHFAPTPRARQNLRAENVPAEHVWVTGNTVIDALQQISQRIDESTTLAAKLQQKFLFLDHERRLILVTGHRRENFGDGIEAICNALKRLAKRGDVQIVYSVHQNPNVKTPVETLLGAVRDVHLLPPQDYLSFVYLMKRAAVILTDSGGIQEEAPALGKPVLVMRDMTERPEAIEAGTARLVGTDCSSIVEEVGRLLDDTDAYSRMATSQNPYGDGTAAHQIATIIQRFLHET